jgi:hypothetical protein
VFEFQNEQVARDNETNFRETWMLAKVLLEFKWAGSPCKYTNV